MLSELIEAHKSALLNLDIAADKLASITDRFDEEFGDSFKVKVPGQAISTWLGRVEVDNIIDDAFNKRRSQIVPFIKLLSPDFAKEVDDFLLKSCVECHDAAVLQFDAERNAKDEFGLTAIEKEYEDANSIEVEAATAICVYRCATIEEEQERWRYIFNAPSIIQSLPDLYAPRILQSVNGEPVEAIPA